MSLISQKFALFSHPAEMEPLLPGEHRLGPLLEQAHDLMRSAGHLAGMCQPEALLGLRGLLRAMHSYYSNKIEGQHTLPAEIEQALRNDYASDADKARRQRLALAHMATEASMEAHAREWDWSGIWSPRMLQDIHQDLFARLQPDDRRLSEQEEPLHPGQLRAQQVSVGRHAAPDAAKLPDFLQRWSQFYGGTRRGDRLATAQISALLKRGLLDSDSPYGRLRFGVPQHALRFYFPRLWPEAEAQ